MAACEGVLEPTLHASSGRALLARELEGELGLRRGEGAPQVEIALEERADAGQDGGVAFHHGWSEWEADDATYCLLALTLLGEAQPEFVVSETDIRGAQVDAGVLAASKEGSKGEGRVFAEVAQLRVGQRFRGGNEGYHGSGR